MASNKVFLCVPSRVCLTFVSPFFDVGDKITTKCYELCSRPLNL
jgi:hypothetical protein